MAMKITERKYLVGFILVTTLFFMWGLSYSLLDVLNKHFQDAMQISKTQSGLLQTAYFGAYFVIALPAGLFISKFGYKAGIITGLSLYAIGAMLFLPASTSMRFEFFLISLFILACGIGFLETSANPYSAALGNLDNAEQRLNLSQSFNGLGQAIGPLIGGLLFFQTGKDVMHGGTFNYVSLTYLAIAVLAILIMLLFIKVKLPDLRSQEQQIDQAFNKNVKASMWHHKEFTAGIIALFFYVGAQVGVSAFFINLMLETWPTSTAKQASFYLSIGLTAFMIGRFLSTALMSKFSSHKILMVYAIINTILCIVIIMHPTYIATLVAILVFFFMSIMFPTIFAMAVKNLGSNTKLASSFMIMAIVGGAIAPLVMGLIADYYSTPYAYILPLICFIIVALYATNYKKLAAS